MTQESQISGSESTEEKSDQVDIVLYTGSGSELKEVRIIEVKAPDVHFGESIVETDWGHTVGPKKETTVQAIPVTEILAQYVRLEQRYDQLLTLLIDMNFSSVAQHQKSSLDKGVPLEDVSDGPSPARSSLQEGSIVRIELDEDPLTAQLLGMLFTTLTRLMTKYWLISQGRFADVVEFSKSHDERFIREAQAVITHISYNSPFNFDVKLSTTDVGQGVVTTIDGIIQMGQRFKQMELVTEAKAQDLQQAEQRFAEEIQRTKQLDAFEQEKRQLELARQQLEVEKVKIEVEKQRLALLEARLETQRKSMEHAFTLANQVIVQLHPDADDTTKRMLVQTYVEDILQLSGISFKSVTVIQAVPPDQEP